MRVCATAIAAVVLAVAAGPAWATRSDVDTNSALKALTGGVTTTAYRAGYYSAGDGGDALYSWNGASSCTDDGGACIQPNSGTGRWILNANGAQSIKVFGAKCDGSTDDTAKIQNALKAIAAAFVPSNSVCNINMASASDGLKLGSSQSFQFANGAAHLYGQDKITSVLNFNRSITPSFDFVTAHQFVNIVVASNVATVTTVWSHQLKPGQTVSITDSLTPGLGGTKTIRSIGSNPAQTDSYNTFSFTTSGVANGTYTDPTHITGQSGINIAAIYSPQRDVNDINKYVTFELDHLTLRAAGTTIPMTWIDLSGTRYSSAHDILIDTSADTGTYFDNMQVAVRCVDRSPNNYNNATDCFFSHVYDLWATGVTFFLQAPSAAGVNNQMLFERFNGGAEVIGDFTGNQTVNGMTMIQGYLSSDGSPLSIDFAGGGSGQSQIIDVGIEGAHTLTLPASNEMVFTDGTSDDQIQVPNLGIGAHTVAGLDACPTGAVVGQMTLVVDANSSTFNAAIAGGGSNTVLALCTSGGWKVH